MKHLEHRNFTFLHEVKLINPHAVIHSARAMVVKTIAKIKIPYEYITDYVEKKLVTLIKEIEKEYEVDGEIRYIELNIDEDLEKIAEELEKSVDEITDEDILYYAYSKRKDIYIVIKEVW